MTRLLVTGASGLLGLNLALYASQRGDQVTGLVNSHSLPAAPFEVRALDLVRYEGMERLLDETRPEVMIHCAAVANLDAAEAQPDLAWRLNGEIPGLLAARAAQRGIKFVHISTDAVFDGLRGNYSESDATNPLGLYARTKLAGEQAVLEANPSAIVARVVFYGWSLTGKRSLAEFFINHLSAGKPVQGFTDVIFCPLLVNNLAVILMQMVDKGLSGIYHAVSREALSKYAFGVAIARRFGWDETLIRPVSMAGLPSGEGGLVARRSLNLTLCTDKLAAALGLPLPAQSDGLQRFYELYQDGYPARIRNLVKSEE